MKKIILLVLCVALGLPTFAQKRSKRNQPDTVIIHDTVYHYARTLQEKQDSAAMSNEIIKLESQTAELKYQEALRAKERTRVLDSLDLIAKQMEGRLSVPCYDKSLDTKVGYMVGRGIAMGQGRSDGSREAMRAALAEVEMRLIGVVENVLDEGTFDVQKGDVTLDDSQIMGVVKSSIKQAVNSLAFVTCREDRPVEGSETKWDCYVTIEVPISHVYGEILKNLPEETPESIKQQFIMMQQKSQDLN